MNTELFIQGTLNNRQENEENILIYSKVYEDL